MDDVRMKAYYQQVSGQVQFGPAYRCWICGEPVLGVRAYADAHRGSRTFLDRYGPHLAYLMMGPSCLDVHPGRVVVVGPAITPVDLDVPTLDERVARIEEAIDLLTELLAEKREAGEQLAGFDRTLSLVLCIRAGILTPADAVTRIHALAGVSMPALVTA